MFKIIGNFFRDFLRLMQDKPLGSGSYKMDSDTRLARSVASRFARGNPAMSAGCFVTTADLEREREEVRQLNFVQDAKKRGLIRGGILYPIEQIFEHRKAVVIAKKFRDRFKK